MSYTGVAWLSSARVVKCQVNSANGRNPCFLLKNQKRLLKNY